MRIIDTNDVLSELCKNSKKWGIFINTSSEYQDLEEVLKAAPYLNVKEHIQILIDGVGWILCDSEEEMENLYWSTVGDDGPTRKNSYNGPVKVYALTCDPNGILLNENT